MESSLSITQLILRASLPVQMIILLLAVMFVYCLYIIWTKWALLKFATRDLNYFESHFWSGADIAKLHQDAQQKGSNCTGLEAIFLSGFQEFLRLKNQVNYEPEFVVSNASRAMRATLTREIDELESHLPWLATTGSVSPYFGLFGTVIGVMNSFIALGAVKQVTLAQVAPGIAEALIATAIGLMAAIPAVMAYNRFVTQVEKMSLRYENFVDEFANILARQYSQTQNLQKNRMQAAHSQAAYVHQAQPAPQSQPPQSQPPQYQPQPPQQPQYQPQPPQQPQYQPQQPPYQQVRPNPHPAGNVGANPYTGVRPQTQAAPNSRAGYVDSQGPFL